MLEEFEFENDLDRIEPKLRAVDFQKRRTANVWSNYTLCRLNSLSRNISWFTHKIDLVNHEETRQESGGTFATPASQAP